MSLVSRTASRHGAGIEPLLSISVDFYVRLFVRVTKNKAAARRSITDNSFYLLCSCFNFREVPLNKRTGFHSECDVCGGNMKLCGPFWNRDMQDRAFVDDLRMRTSDTRITGVLNVILSEVDVFGYFSVGDLGKFVKCAVPSMKKLACAIANAGFNVSFTHCKLSALKTNAPLALVYAILLRSDNKTDGRLRLGTYEISFEHNEVVSRMASPEFYRGSSCSHMGPLAKKQATSNSKQARNSGES